MPTRLLFVAAVLSQVPLAARAHCDTLDGPVVKTARAALDANDVVPVLAWVKPSEEQRIRTAFREALEAREQDPAASSASDRRFFETLVRVHRAGEGAPYSGLKPAGAGVSEAVQAADRGIEEADGSGVEQLLVAAVRAGLRSRFAAVSTRERPGHDVAAGRAWVEAYVDYVHYVERLEAVARAVQHGHGEGEASSPPAEASHRHAHAH